MDFLALAFASLSARHIVTQLIIIVFSEPVDGDVTFGDGVSYVELSRLQVLIGHFTVMDGDEAEGDLVLIQTFLLYYVNQVILMLTSIFQEQFP